MEAWAKTLYALRRRREIRAGGNGANTSKKRHDDVASAPANEKHRRHATTSSPAAATWIREGARWLAVPAKRHFCFIPSLRLGCFCCFFYRLWYFAAACRSPLVLCECRSCGLAAALV